MKKSWLIFSIALLTWCSRALYAGPAPTADENSATFQDRLAGNLFGVRSTGLSHGLDFTAQSYSDVLGNILGGASRALNDSGVLNLGLSLDLNQAVGWPGASINTTWVWVYGDNLSAQHVHNALTASGIAGDREVRCYELWFEQNLLNGAFSFRAGLLGLDDEFLISDTASLFVNSTFGIPGIFTLDVFQGEPVYQNGTPGVRLAVLPVPWLTLRSAFVESSQFLQQLNHSGFNGDLNQSGDYLSLNEAAAAWNRDSSDKGLAGSAKIGFWVQTSRGHSSDQSTSGYNTGFYAIIDQQLTKPPASQTPAPASSDKDGAPAQSTQPSSGDDSEHNNVIGLSAFARAGLSPRRASQVSFYVDSGLVYTGLIPGRKSDKCGVAFAYAAARSPFYTNQLTSSDSFSPSFEAVAEVSYAIQVTPAVTIQPDMQWIVHPGGAQEYGNALVIGVRGIINF